jgi:hypothetical protein
VPVRAFVRFAFVPTRAIGGINARCRKFVFVDVPLVRVMQVTIVQKIGMTVVFHSRMAAIVAVRVFVRLVRSVAGHLNAFPICNSLSYNIAALTRHNLANPSICPPGRLDQAAYRFYGIIIAANLSTQTAA